MCCHCIAIIKPVTPSSQTTFCDEWQVWTIAFQWWHRWLPHILPFHFSMSTFTGGSRPQRCIGFDILQPAGSSLGCPSALTKCCWHYCLSFPLYRISQSHGAVMPPILIIPFGICCGALCLDFTDSTTYLPSSAGPGPFRVFYLVNRTGKRPLFPTTRNMGHSRLSATHYQVLVLLTGNIPPHFRGTNRDVKQHTGLPCPV